MSVEQAIEMYVGGLVLDPNTQAPIVILKDESGNICLPIWIGIAEATSIASAIKQVTMARPLTHDLMFDIFMEMGIKLERVVITDLRDSTYFAELVIAIGDRVVIIDARPSDAIAMALRATCPIFVTQQVLDQAKMNFTQEGSAAPGAVPPNPDQAESIDAEELQTADEKDFKNIDKDKWTEILQKLGPDDFKNKM